MNPKKELTGIEKNSSIKKLREQFQKPVHDTKIVADVLGIIKDEMQESIIADLTAMIDKSYRAALEGYIYCLSRIVRHDVGWTCIIKAFAAKNEQVPKKYYAQFGQLPEQQKLKK
jgi:hypothetical protein